MTYRRSRIELYVDILQAIANGRESPARIVYAANLSYDRVVRHLSFLTEQKLADRIEGKKKRFRITERGLEVIRYFKEVEAALFLKKKTFTKINVHFTPSKSI
jgi:predicted transcriptional regulator